MQRAPADVIDLADRLRREFGAGDVDEDIGGSVTS
jgi:hypothetical protein